MTPIVVLSMPRSGTSLLAKILGALGAELPSDPIPTSHANPEGYFESQKLLALRVDLERTLGINFSFPQTLAPTDLSRLSEEKFRGFRNRAASYFQDVSGVEHFVFKDPRTAALLPFWERFFQEEGYDPKYVICVRNPLAVIASVSQFNGLPLRAAELVWLETFINIFKFAKFHKVAVVQYEKWFDGPEQLRALNRALFGKSGVPESALKQITGKTVNPSLNRSGRALREHTLWSATQKLYDWIGSLDVNATGVENDGPLREVSHVLEMLTDTSQWYFPDIRNELIEHDNRLVMYEGIIADLRHRLADIQAQPALAPNPPAPEVEKSAPPVAPPPSPPPESPPAAPASASIHGVRLDGAEGYTVHFAENWERDDWIKHVFLKGEDGRGEFVSQHQARLQACARGSETYTRAISNCFTHGFVERLLLNERAEIKCPVTGEWRTSTRCTFTPINSYPFLTYYFTEKAPHLIFCTGFLNGAPLFACDMERKEVFVLTNHHYGWPIPFGELVRNATEFLESPSETVGQEAIRPTLILGFSHGNLGHGIWSDLTAVSFLVESGLIARVAALQVGPEDYLNLRGYLRDVYSIPFIESDRSGGLVPDGSPSQLFFRCPDIPITRAAQKLGQKVADHFAKTPQRNLDSEELKRAEALGDRPNDAGTRPRLTKIVFQLRSSRTLRDQVMVFAALIEHLSRYKEVTFAVDGMSDYDRGSFRDAQYEQTFQNAVQNELKVYDNLRAAVPPSIQIESWIGRTVTDKIHLYEDCYFVGPVGSGCTVPSWILRRPGTVFGSAFYCTLGLHQETHCVEEPSRLNYVHGEPLTADGMEIDVPSEALLKGMMSGIEQHYFLPT